MKRRRPVQVKKSLNIRMILSLTAAFVLVAALSIGGTLAWLQDETETVTNTFTTAGIDITLTETPNTDSDNDGENDKWEAQLIPSKPYTKDPVVTVEDTTDVPVYLFVEVNEGSCTTYLDYTLAWNYESTGEGDTNAALYSGWIELTGTDIVDNTVYYRVVNPTEDDQSWHLIVGDKVTVKDLTQNTMAANDQMMTFTAYAIQTANGNTEFTAAEAWAQIKPDANP